eukprot:TRINITY_DN51612_c0_g1_i1.p1 TRINITY_DN51612_c0_g1~~TRINITY_DN51612_c0_g1_i1.p1  ORF type:complete len:671 (+),score=123.73 TRINITY_DN51612_c0_g1_i1:88-2100(+)
MEPVPEDRTANALMRMPECEMREQPNAGWEQFQSGLKDLMAKHYNACEHLVRDLVTQQTQLQSCTTLGGGMQGSMPCESGAATAQSNGLANGCVGASGCEIMPVQFPSGDPGLPKRRSVSYGVPSEENQVDAPNTDALTNSDVLPATLLDAMCEPTQQVEGVARISTMWETEKDAKKKQYVQRSKGEVELKDLHQKTQRLLVGESGESARKAARLAGEVDTRWNMGSSSDRLGASFVSRTELHLQGSSNVASLTAFMGFRIGFLEELAIKWEALTEPPRTGCLARLEQNKAFELLCALVIITNTAFIILATNAEMAATKRVEAEEASELQHGGLSYAQIDYGFFCFYLFELLLRLGVHRLYFFCNDDCSWNCLDFFLVMLSVVELAVSAASSNMNLMFLRVLRLLKVSKLLRVVRAVRFLSELRIFLECFRGCALSLFWAMIMIGLVLLVFALFFVQAAASQLQEQSDGGVLDTDTNGVSRTEVLKAFGSVEGAMLTLLQIACGFGEWDEKFKVLSATGVLNAILFIFFIVFFAVAVWNIVTSVFLENTMKMMLPDREGELLEKHRQDVEHAKELMRICSLADIDRSGTVSVAEFEEFMLNETFRQYFDMRGIDIKDTELFFNMITTSTGSEEVDLEAFVGSSKEAGPANGGRCLFPSRRLRAATTPVVW